MNIVLDLLLAGAAITAAAWALVERSRAAAAAARATMLEANAGAVKAQAALAAQEVADALVRRAGETFARQEEIAHAKLEAQLKPVAETLQKVQAQAERLERSRAEDSGGLKEQISALLAASASTQEEARKLSAALRRGAGVQGRWGEQTLRNVLEAAGLSKHFDFDEQASVQTDHGRRRPDVCVYMPNNGLFVVDAKCSLNAYLDAQDAPDDNAREAALARHATSVRNHINELSGKAYWDQFEGSPDFVVMFVPGDGILAAALDRAPELMTEAMDRRVMLATPSTLFALCKAVAYGWRMQDQAQSSAQIAELGRELYKRIAVMAEHAQQLGRSLDTAVRRYNDFTGSLETRVLSQARRFEELAADHEGKRVPELAQLESRVLRLVEAPPEPAALTLREAAPTSAA